MKSSVEQLSPTRVRINVQVPFTELEPDFQRAYKELAKQIRLPGFRPGKPTSDFIRKVLNKITLFGALFLGVVAVLPIVLSNVTQVTGLALGGTSVLIVVGVALETVKSMESQMLMRHYKGFLE